MTTLIRSTCILLLCTVFGAELQQASVFVQEPSNFVSVVVEPTAPGRQLFSNFADLQIDCNGQGESRYCQLETVPEEEFDVSRGSLSSSAPACCKRKYIRCQLQEMKQYCRPLMQYIIPSGTDTSEGCPLQPDPDCNCQQMLSGGKYLVLDVCQKQEPCCPECHCHGVSLVWVPKMLELTSLMQDPHCKGFDGNTKSWSVCDGRDEQCNRNQAQCLATMYQGQSCQWISRRRRLKSYCGRNPNTQVPQMIMHQKFYASYFDALDHNIHEFKLVLYLGNYGSIARIELFDHGVKYNFGFNRKGRCQANAKFHLRPGNWVHVDGLPSGVSIRMVCHDDGRFAAGRRWDIKRLTDPWYGLSSTDVFGGFCPNSTIVEMEKESDSIPRMCPLIERTLQRHVCGRRSTMDDCKRMFCDRNAGKLTFPPDTYKGCYDYLFEPDTQNWLAALCAKSRHVSNQKYPVDPTKCYSNTLCRTCMDDISDFPQETTRILSLPFGNGDRDIDLPCFKDLTRIGLERKQLPPIASGVQVERNEDGQWKPQFAVFDEEIAACGGCLSFNFSATGIPEAQNMLTPGEYRVRQCVGLVQEGEDLCKSNPATNVSVAYTNLVEGAAASIPYGVLYNMGALVCCPIVYPNCPEKYRCCIWEPGTFGWESCMDSNHPGWKFSYPSCGATV